VESLAFVYCRISQDQPQNAPPGTGRRNLDMYCIGRDPFEAAVEIPMLTLVAGLSRHPALVLGARQHAGQRDGSITARTLHSFRRRAGMALERSGKTNTARILASTAVAAAVATLDRGRD
jgi:hypothetical protein